MAAQTSTFLIFFLALFILMEGTQPVLAQCDNELEERLSVVEQMLETCYVCNAAKAALLFPTAGTSGYVIKYGMPSLTAVTICFWMKSTDQGNTGTPLSYAVSGSTNELLIDHYRSFVLSIGSSTSGSTSVSAVDGNWHHICLTWENGAGAWKVYKDGAEAANGQGLKTGHVIAAGGTLILGQEQDKVGGGFDASQSFVGELTGVNIWNHVINAPEIANLATSCVAGEGNVFKWAEFTPHVRGEAQLITSTCQTA